MVELSMKKNITSGLGFQDSECLHYVDIISVTIVVVAAIAASVVLVLGIILVWNRRKLKECICGKQVMLTNLSVQEYQKQALLLSKSH